VIERGEDVVLPVTIRNNGAVNLTGISAVLTTTTPDVTITRSTATYPDAASGLTATSNAPHYAFSVGPSVPCGGDIAFNLAIQSSQGVFNSSFTVKVGRVATATNNYPSTDVPKPIPDNNATGATSTVAVADTNLVQGVKVTVNITHTWDGDLTLALIGPTGIVVTLSANRGSLGDNYTNTVFDDAAATPIGSGTAPFTGAFRPETPLAGLSGIPANGTWSLKVVDSAGGDTGTITGWTLQLTTGAGWACTDCVPTAPTGEPVQQLWVGQTGQQWEGIAGATSYNLYRGVPADLPQLLTAAADSCLRLTTSGPSTGAVLTETPTPGSFYWYLVRAANTVGEGPAGAATAGPRVHNSAGTCP
jgi:subtilisin-like proprotein convertase family protein